MTLSVQSSNTITWYSYPLIFQELRGTSLNPDQFLIDFEAIPLPPLVSVIESAAASDNFFEKYGVGNDLTNINRPYERFHAYELLLEILSSHNRIRYEHIHKGTPFYFMGWTAFQTENYEKGIYYFDQAIAEDIRKSESADITVIRNNPAVKSLLLDPQNLPGIVVALELRREMDDAFSRFNQGSGLAMDANSFVSGFVIGSGNYLDSTFRTIVTSIYSFILEYHTLVTSLQLRSIGGGSLEPFFLHLFKGCLLLESILKLRCPRNITTLYPAISHLNSRLQLNMSDLRGGTLDEVVQHVKTLRGRRENFQNLSFAAAYGVRNTTGHNLMWSDIFGNNSATYQNFFSLIMNAILWAVYKLWVLVP